MTASPIDETSAEFAATARQFSDIAARSQKIVQDFLKSQQESGLEDLDPLNIGGAFLELTQKMMADPKRLWELQTQYWSDYVDLWTNTTRRMLGDESAEPKVATDPDDRRFKDAAWTDNAAFEYVKQSYLLAAQYIQRSVAETEELDDQTSHKVAFFTKQWIDAMAPTNFAVTNPEVLRATVDSKGENLVNGINNLLTDLERGKGKLSIRMTDETKFKVGENVAASPGSVVFQNDLIQLIQYTPTTEKAFRRPLLIIPPWINKFYILDLRNSNSFIRWAVAKGHAVFVVSWVNPDTRLAAKTFEDYMIEGPLAAMEAIEQATGEKQVNMIGYCLGGTLTACTMAHLANSGQSDRVKSVTYFATLVDFENAGDLCVFIDDEQLKNLEKRMEKKGYLEGRDMSTTFNMLRANDLIWSFVINNYLLGKDPFPLDLLYWNSDSTRMPAAMHTFYLRNMYQKNLLTKPDGMKLLGTPINLNSVKAPTFILSTKEDHIAPWKATYSSTQLYGGSVTFCLSGSGHIAGVVNPEGSDKYGYWVNARTPQAPDEWYASATKHEGSWWPVWQKWISRQGGGKVAARSPGDGKLKVIEAAPGSYVKVRSSD
ncbi:MAG: class I poly(R)-hydroxyalkanoic acid synthase [Rhodospirillaceae bacterium]|nr:class I poly(R)-hydroxyalkanoic acid synthase [Rhodospirillaceae bacterium]